MYRYSGTVTSLGYNVVDVELGPGTGQSGFAAATGGTPHLRTQALPITPPCRSPPMTAPLYRRLPVHCARLFRQIQRQLSKPCSPHLTLTAPQGRDRAHPARFKGSRGGERMARYKHTDTCYGQGLFMNVNLKEQLLPGTFEFMLNELMKKEIDISMFDQNYKNDETGATAIPPRVLIKLIIYGYYKGVNSSRKLMDFSNENVIARALCEDMKIHWTTIAHFISFNNEKFKEIFVKALLLAEELDLVAWEELGVDGRRMQSNASIDMSGTKKELQKRLETFKRMADKHVAKHLKRDKLGELREDKRLYEKRQKRLQNKIREITDFLDTMESKKGKCVEEIKSNVTDNDSTMIRSSKGV